LPYRVNTLLQPLLASASMLAILGAAACSSGDVDSAPPTIVPAQAAVSPPAGAAPAGVVRPVAVEATAAAFDSVTRSLVVLGARGDGVSALTVLSDGRPPRTVALTGAATAMAAGGDGAMYLAARGGYYRFDVAASAATRVDVEGQADTEFTAVARRADGRVVLGSADGAVVTLAATTGPVAAVSAELKIFARVDAIVTQGDTAVVLDRGQTSVTTVDPAGTDAEHALRAGSGATTMAADPAGRVLVADTRGDGLLVYGLDPLILRQQYPVRGAPYGLAASPTLVWVSQTATNTVVGYDLATGIPVEKVRYRTVRQPDFLAFDDASGTLYVVSGAAAGVQVIADAAGGAR
jgi:hypothetical protein